MRTVSDRIYTVGLPNGAGPAVVPLFMQLPDMSEAEVTAWIGNFGGSNVYLFEGDRSMVDAENQLADDTAGLVDCIMALTGTGPVSAPIDEGIRHLTVFFEGVNSSGQSQTVSIRVRARSE